MFFRNVMKKLLLSLLLMSGFANAEIIVFDLVDVQIERTTKRVKQSANEKVKNHILSLYDKVPSKDVDEIIDNVMIFSKKYDLEPGLLLGLIESESGFQKGISNGYGAKGVMQVVQSIHHKRVSEHLKKNGGNIYALNNNIEIGSKLLRDMIDIKGSVLGGLKMYKGSNSPKYYQKVFRLKSKYDNLLSI